MRGLLHTSISQREWSFKLADRRRCEGPRKQSVSEPRRLEGHGCGESTRNSREGGMAREDCLRKSSANKGSTEWHFDCCLVFCEFENDNEERRRMEKEQGSQRVPRRWRNVRKEGRLLTSSSMYLRRWYAPQLESTWFGCSGDGTSLRFF